MLSALHYLDKKIGPFQCRAASSYLNPAGTNQNMKKLKAIGVPEAMQYMRNQVFDKTLQLQQKNPIFLFKSKNIIRLRSLFTLELQDYRTKELKECRTFGLSDLQAIHVKPSASRRKICFYNANFCPDFKDLTFTNRKNQVFFINKTLNASSYQDQHRR